MYTEDKAASSLFIINRTQELIEQFPKKSKVSKNLTQPHKLIIPLKAAFNQKKNNHYEDYEDILLIDRDLLAISVTKSLSARALKFTDSFIKLMEKAGHQIEVRSHETYCIVNDEHHQIKIREKCSRKIFDRTSRMNWSYLVPNGKLSLKIAHSYKQKEWCDGRETLEEQIPKIVAGLELRSKIEKEERESIRIYHEEQERLQLIKKQKQARKDWEIKKEEILLNHAVQWNHANKLDLFLNHLEDKFKNQEALKEERTDWLTWARSIQQAMDPSAKTTIDFLNAYAFNDSQDKPKQT